MMKNRTTMADTSDGGVCIGVCDTMNVALHLKVIVFFERQGCDG